MAYFRCGGAGIPSSLKTGMNNVLNKKFGTVAQDYTPADWPDDVNLLGLLEEKTVSGAIASFSDGADDVPLKSLVCNVDANLSGVSAVDVVHTGKNLLKLNNGTYSIGGGTSGITGIVNDGAITITGTATRSGGRTTRLSNYFILKAGTYIISPVIATSPYLRSYINRKSDDSVVGYSTGNSFTITEDTEVYFGVQFENGGTYNHTIKPQLECGSSITTYAPYVTPTTHTANLGRTIYGGLVDVVNGTGTDEWGRVVYTGAVSEQWISATTGGIYRYQIANEDVKKPDSSRGVIYSSIGTYASSGNAVGTCFSYWNGTKTTIIYVPPQTCTTVAEFKAWLQNNNFDVVYEKATPEDFTFTPVPINSLLGDNTLWADTGAVNECVYRSQGTVQVYPNAEEASF